MNNLVEKQIKKEMEKIKYSVFNTNCFLRYVVYESTYLKELLLHDAKPLPYFVLS